MSVTPLVLAVPSKGRLQENANAFFSRAGLQIEKLRGAREYRGRIVGLDHVEVAFLSASEIVSNLAQGTAHLGVTGEDLIREQILDADSTIEMLTPLGFGHANVVVAVPQAWIDVRSMADLDDVAATMRAKTGNKLRVATKYINLTRSYFARHGIADYRIIESPGATEGAPAAGTAEIIVDITSTGSTLTANALKVLDDGMMLSSEANLVGSLKAAWPEETRQSAHAILSRIAAEEEARNLREVCAKVDDPSLSLAETLKRTHGASLPFGLPDKNGILTIHCPSRQVFGLAGFLSQQGAGDITVRTLDYVFRATNPLADKLFARL